MRAGMQIAVCWGDPKASPVITLTQLARAAEPAVDRGDESYVQLACATSDAARTEADVRAHGGAILRSAAPVPGIGTVVAKVADPDGAAPR